ncbi:2'-deoxynucleoside 5'-phosphate N-hydrolase 1, partial [Geodia barretti]
PVPVLVPLSETYGQQSGQRAHAEFLIGAHHFSYRLATLGVALEDVCKLRREDTLSNEVCSGLAPGVANILSFTHSTRPSSACMQCAMLPHELSSIRGGRDDVQLYMKIIRLLQGYGTVLTEHVADERLGAYGEKQISDEEIHKRDFEWLSQSDARKSVQWALN